MENGMHPRITPSPAGGFAVAGFPGRSYRTIAGALSAARYADRREASTALLLRAVEALDERNETVEARAACAEAAALMSGRGVRTALAILGSAGNTLGWSDRNARASARRVLRNEAEHRNGGRALDSQTFSCGWEMGVLS